MSQYGEEFGAWVTKHASVSVSSLLTLIPFFFLHFPFFSHLLFPSSRVLSAPPCPSELLIVLFAPFHALLFSIFFSNPLFHTPPHFLLLQHLSIFSPLLFSYTSSFLLPLPGSVLPKPLKAAINSPVLFPLVLLKSVLWDGINQHQVWHLPEDKERTYTHSNEVRRIDYPCPLYPPGPGRNECEMDVVIPSVFLQIRLSSAPTERWPHMRSRGSISIW